MFCVVRDYCYVLLLYRLCLCQSLCLSSSRTITTNSYNGGDPTGVNYTITQKHNSSTYISTIANETLSHNQTNKCSRTRCLCCKKIDKKASVCSTTTGTNYINADTRCYTCTDQNLIYLIECRKCGMHYVGQTIQLLKERFLQHRGDARRNDKSTYLVKHFNQNGCNFNDIGISVLEGIPENTEENSKKQLLSELENKWILALNTAHPFGMNDNVKAFGNVSSWNSTIETFQNETPYFQVKKPINRKRSTLKKKRNKTVDNNFNELIETLYGNQQYRKLYIYLRSTNKKTIRKAIPMLYSLNASTEIKLIILGYYTGMFGAIKQQPCKKDTDKIVMPYINKTMDNLHLNKIFNKLTKKCILNENPLTNDVKRVTIVYKYDPSVGLQVFNYNKILENKNICHLKELIRQPCRCQEFDNEYKENHSHHILTTDPSILKSKNGQLNCDILNYGTKHRIELPQLINDKIEQIMENSRTYANKIANRHNIKNKQVKIDNFCIEIRNIMESNFNTTVNQNNASIKKIKHEIKKLDLVCTSVDKASNNFAFVCTKYYVIKLLEELNEKTYTATNDDENTIVTSHTLKCKEFKIECPNDINNVIPKLYGNPKLHKNPAKFRYIAGAANASTKPAALVLHKILSYLKNHFYNYCKTIEKRVNVKIYISVDNSIKVINDYNRTNTPIKTICAYDFSTLYTKLPHDIIINKMKELFTLLFNHSTAYGVYVPTTEYGNAFYAKRNDKSKTKTSNNHVLYTKSDLISLLEFIVKESYVRVGNSIFKQKAGIPMGGNASPLIADLTLSFMEFDYLKKHKPFRKCAKIYRYIDDILVINEKFSNHSQLMYPNQLILNADNPKHNKLNYLDITFDTKTGYTKIYNKVDVFNFEVIRSYDANSCVSNQMLNGIIIGQLLRFNRITTDITDFKVSILQFFKTLLQKHHPLITITKTLITYCNKYQNKLWKYKLLDNKLITKKLVVPLINKLK